MSAVNLTTEPYKTHIKHLADMKDWIGKELGLSEWFEINQEQINTFARITEDEQWIHVDPEKSKLYSPYKTTVAHGFMILSLASKFAYETFSIGDAVMGVNYGMDKVRFPNATRVGSWVRARITLLDVEPKGEKGARYKMNVIFELKGEEKPACVAEFIAMAFTA